MQTAVQEQVQDGPELTPEQIEEAAWEEAVALAESEDADSPPITQQEETGQADPAVGAVAEDPPEVTGGEVQQPETAPPDPFVEATPEQQQAWQNLMQEKARYEHDSLSNRNRVSALQKKVNALEEKLQAQPAAKPAEAEKPAELPEKEVGVDLSEFKEDFPEIYKAVGAMYQNQVGKMQAQFDEKLGQLSQKLETVEQPVQQMQETEQDRYRQSQLAALNAAHPDWQQIQGTQEFWSWVESQTEGVKALAGSVAANDNIALLNLYKSHTGQQAAPPPPQAQAPGKPVRQPDVGIPRVNSGGRPRAGIPPQDGEKAFDYWMEHWDEI